MAGPEPAVLFVAVVPQPLGKDGTESVAADEFGGVEPAGSVAGTFV